MRKNEKMQEEGDFGQRFQTIALKLLLKATLNCLNICVGNTLYECHSFVETAILPLTNAWENTLAERRFYGGEKGKKRRN